MAAQQGFLDSVVFLEEMGANLNACRDDGASPLTLATCNNHIEVVRFLASKGVDLNRVSNEHGSTPIIQASTNGLLGMVLLLARCGGDLQAKMKDGRGLLELARDYKRHEMVRLLTDIESAGSWSKYAASLGYAHCLIRLRVATDATAFTTLSVDDPDRELLHFVYGHNEVAVHGADAGLAEEGEQPMLTVPDDVFANIVRFIGDGREGGTREAGGIMPPQLRPPAFPGDQSYNSHEAEAGNDEGGCCIQ